MTLPGLCSFLFDIFKVLINFNSNMGSDLIGPIGPILGAAIAAIVGIIFSIYVDTKKRKNRLKIISNALILEISKFQGFFTSFLEQIQESGGIQNTGSYFQVMLEWITNYGIAVSGPNSSLLSEKSPFSIFYSEIFDYDDLDMVQDIKDFYECILNFDKSFKNFCERSKNVNDLENMVRQSDRALDIIADNKLKEYLKGFN